MMPTPSVQQLRKSLQKSSCSAVGFLTWKRKTYRAIMMASRYIKPCITNTLRITMSMKQIQGEKGPIIYLNMVESCTVIFQRIPYHIIAETSWLIRVLWWLLFSKEIMLKSSGVVKQMPMPENRTANSLELEFWYILVNSNTSLKIMVEKSKCRWV